MLKEGWYHVTIVDAGIKTGISYDKVLYVKYQIQNSYPEQILEETFYRDDENDWRSDSNDCMNLEDLSDAIGLPYFVRYPEQLLKQQLMILYKNNKITDHIPFLSKSDIEISPEYPVLTFLTYESLARYLCLTNNIDPDEINARDNRINWGIMGSMKADWINSLLQKQKMPTLRWNIE